MSSPAPRGWLRTLLRLPIVLYNWRLGWLLGHRFCLLGHLGRHSGRLHETVLEVVAYRGDGPRVVVTSGWGPRTDWLLNAQANPPPYLMVGRQRLATPSVRLLSSDEALAAWADYERRNRYMAPLMRYVLSRLLGWRYDSSPAARRKLVEQLPGVEFGPR